MQGFADFTDSLLSGTLLVFLSLALGSLPFAWFVLPRSQGPARERALRRCSGLLAAGALGLALCQVASLALKGVVLSGFLGPEALGSFAQTLQFRAGCGRALLAALLAVAALGLRARPRSRGRTVAVTALALALASSGAWLVHGAGRSEWRAPLMGLTVLHQFGAAIWVGGVIQLAALWRLSRGQGEEEALWRAAVPRFGRVAAAALALLLAAAAPLASAYVGSLEGLIGTGYGSLVATKVGLMAVALALGALNWSAGRARGGRGASLLRARVPYLVEVEAILLVVLVYVAATLATQPPAIDIDTERASLGEVVEVFRPKWPTFRTPSVATMAADSTDAFAVAGGERTPAAYSWSNFSHNVAGLVLLGLSLLALAAWSGRVPWARHWPLGLIGLGIFVFLRTSADSNTWPFGPVPFWQNTTGDAEVLQHRLGALLPLALGLMEWRARRSERQRTPLGYVFPALAGLGGILLLTHAHTAFEPKSSFLVQVTHTTMGALAVIMACARLLELRLEPPAARAAGLVSGLAMLSIALVLVFYREANVVVPADSPAITAELGVR